MESIIQSEKLLQFIWNHKTFTNFDFIDTEGNSVEILDFGQWNHDSGPDFLMAKIKINDLILVGNIELHIKSSDWIFHQHSNNKEFDNLILHVVFQNDVEIEELLERNISTIELKNHIDTSTLLRYQQLISESKFIPCEKIFDPEKIPFLFAENQLLNKLDEKSSEIEISLKAHKNNYEAVLFHYMAYAFGLKVNGLIFKQIAEGIDFSIINKIRQNQTQLEALFFGASNWVDESKDEMMNIWKKEYDFLKNKFNLSDSQLHPKFLRLRPPNFPTIRLSQLANLYHLQPNLFSKIVHSKSIDDLLKLFENVKASTYWKTHFNFAKISNLESEKFLTRNFIDLLLINAILPIKYTYHKYHQEDIADEIIELYKSISSEENSITKEWKSLKVPMKNSLESQAYIYHYKNFCVPKKCLNCGIGIRLLK